MLPYLGVFSLGLQLGATACAVSCMPVMTPILLSSSRDKTQTLALLVEYFGAKIVAYTFIALLSFLSASALKTVINDHQIFVKIAGVFIVILGFTLLYKSLFTKKSCTSECGSSSKFGYFGIGFFSSFSFCFPVTSLVTISGSTDVLLNSLFYGLSFGFGVVLIPFLLLYFFIYKITSTFLTEFMKHKKAIEIFSQIFLLCIGISVFQGWIRL